MASENRPRKRQPSATTHHEPYPDRLHRHLDAAATAVEALSAPETVEGDSGTPGELVGRYGAPDEPGEGLNE